MFSKYSSVEVPKNYSGNRFRQAQELKTETKTHFATNYSATKSSVSPSYHEQNSYIDEVQDDIESKSFEDESIEQVEDIEKTYDENQKSTFSFNDIIKSIDAEDLLLICLIIFLSADSGINNNDIVILLSLLLAYHI